MGMFEIVFGEKGFGALSSKVGSLNDKISQARQNSDFTKNLDKTKSALSDLSSPASNIIYKLESMGAKVTALNTLLNKDTKGFLSSVSDRSKNASENFKAMRENGVGFATSLAGAADAFIIADDGSRLVNMNFSSLLLKVKTVLPKLLMMGTVIAGIAAVGVIAFKSLKKAWDVNVGGIQTKWNGFMGNLKGSMSRFGTIMSKALRKISPLIDIVLRPIFSILNGIVDLASGIAEGFMIGLGPILDIGQAVGEVLQDLFGTTKNGIDVMKNFGKILGVVLVPLAIYKTVGLGIIAMTHAWTAAQWLLNFALNANPLGMVIMGVAALVAIVWALWEPIKQVGEWFDKIFGGSDDKTITVREEKNVDEDSKSSLRSSARERQAVSHVNNVNVHTSREISGAGAAGFADVMARDLSGVR